MDEKLKEDEPRVRDDSQLRIRALATRARKELNLSASEIDWPAVFNEVRRLYREGTQEWDVDWERIVRECVKKKRDRIRAGLLALQAASVVALISLFAMTLMTRREAGSLRAELEAQRR